MGVRRCQASERRSRRGGFTWLGGESVFEYGVRLCSLCGHAWAEHHGAGELSPWVTCTFGTVSCFCRRTVEEAHAEMDGAPSPACATCGQRPAQDTQCRPCREDRQRRAERDFALWWEELGARSRQGGRAAGRAGRAGRVGPVGQVGRVDASHREVAGPGRADRGPDVDQDSA
jgi:hypothetical protein